MANTNAPFGFSQYRGTGSSPTYEQVTATIAYNTAAIFYGDPVWRLSDSSLAGNTTGPGPTTTPLAGIFIGCKYLSVAQKRTVWSNYWPGSDVVTGGTAEAYYVNDPAAQFLAQVGNSTTIGATQGNVGQNVQFLYGAGNTASGLSGAVVDIGILPATTAGFPFRLVGLVTNPPGGPGTQAGAYNRVIVAFNNVETKSLTATN